VDAVHDDRDLWCATARNERESVNCLTAILPGSTTSRFVNIAWPARSPDLSATDWGHLRAQVCVRKPRTFGELNKHNRDEISATDRRLLRTVFDTF
jgi:hypothetical protein